MISSGCALTKAIDNYKVIAYVPTCYKNEHSGQELYKTYYMGEDIDFQSKMKYDTSGCMGQPYVYFVDLE